MDNYVSPQSILCIKFQGEIIMKFIKKTVTATFVRREKRFRGFVEYKGETIMVHVPNTGRLLEILVPGTQVLLRVEDNPNRKTAFTMIAAYKNGALINIDSQIPNDVVEDSLKRGLIPELKRFTKISREKVFQKSRFDFYLESEEGEKYFLEVKGVTLEHEGIASFPGAPTERGIKHITELMEAKEEGYSVGILFLMQMENMVQFTPAYHIDPLFSATLEKAHAYGVEILAYGCTVTESSLDLAYQVPVVFKNSGFLL